MTMIRPESLSRGSLSVNCYQLTSFNYFFFFLTSPLSLSSTLPLFIAAPAMKSPENNHSQHLDDCCRLLTSLSACIPSVRSFLGRWAAVSATLDRLRASIDYIAALPSNYLTNDLLNSLSQTLTLTLSLSQYCLSPDPPAGRLRTQSDLSAAASSLHQLAADAEFLIRNNALHDPFPSSPSSSPPPPASRREALRAEARTIVTRLQIGTLASRVPALDSLIAMLCGDDKNVLIAATQGLVPVLVRLLGCSSLSHPEARLKAVAAISRISSVESCRHLLFAEGASLVSHLSRVLVEPDGGGSAKEKACVALQALTLQKDIAMLAGSGGGISILLETCRSGTPPAQAAAAGVLKNLSALQELRESFSEENAFHVLVRVLQSGTVLAQENATACLANLTAGEENQSIKLVIFQEGVLDCIINYWEASSVDHRDLEPAIRLLRNLSSTMFFAEIILSSGFLPRVILALDSLSTRTRTEAARAISELSVAYSKLSRDGAEHAVPRLVGMLEAKDAEEKDASVRALASLMSSAECRRLMRKDEKGIIKVIMLLDPLVCNVEKKHAVSVLLAVSQTRRCRKLVVAAGARRFLPWLEEMQVEGNKKLSEVLTKGKLLGVIPRS